MFLFHYLLYRDGGKGGELPSLLLAGSICHAFNQMILGKLLCPLSLSFLLTKPEGCLDTPAGLGVKLSPVGQINGAVCQAPPWQHSGPRMLVIQQSSTGTQWCLVGARRGADLAGCALPTPPACSWATQLCRTALLLPLRNLPSNSDCSSFHPWGCTALSLTLPSTSFVETTPGGAL